MSKLNSKPALASHNALRWDRNTLNNNQTAEDDLWNSAYHDQGFLASFFTSNMMNKTMHSMSSTALILSSRSEK